MNAVHTTFSNIIVVVYLLGTLFLRLILEPQMQGNFLLSIALGVFALLFLWALVKSKVLRPTLFKL